MTCCDAALPHFVSGRIVKGFGRGSEALGIPTANFSEDVVEKLPENLAPGIYYGWTSVDDQVYKGVLSIGWNPFYKNEKKSMETHILHNFHGPLHGKELRVVITGFIRPEKDFSSVDELIKEITNDIEIAKNRLEEPEMFKYKDHEFLKGKKEAS
ncbi:riboflavin kinase [Venturia canescens]|uniref:riboflavin kinase n=1 Tax=Venturia canescens TaxID=32260 RepID=UPI001C9C1398|nr:riboflavin kinase [Venturia canescens]